VREHYIDDKVVLLTRRVKVKSPLVARMEKDRHLHAICNQIHQEFMKIQRNYKPRIFDMEQRMLDAVYRILKAELK
jgi:hypothetical protein